MKNSSAEKNFSGRFSAFLILFAFGVAMTFSAQAGVVNGDFSAGDTGFSTGYGFINSGTSTSPNTFGIRTNSQDFNPGYNNFGDHTTGIGNMMLMDGVADTVAWQETLPVAANSNYVFSVWTTACDDANPASLVFSINGTTIGSPLVLSNTPGQWQHFIGIWNSGSASSAVLTITDLNGVSFGNDFALDDISFDPAGTNAVTVSIYTAVGINWISSTNQNYQVQYTSALNPNSWSNLGPPVAGNGTNNTVFDPIGSQSARFYRIIPLP
jgi:hypothetical protein